MSSSASIGSCGLSLIFKRAFFFCFIFFLLAASHRALSNECKDDLGSLASDQAAEEYAHLSETYRWADLLSSDPQNNLVVRHPAMLMSPAQLVYSIFTSIPSYEIPDPVFGVGKVRIYPLFEGVSELTGSKMIVGSYDAKSAVVESAKHGAAGDGSEQKLVVLTGPSGTGKTEFIDVFGRAVSQLVRVDPNFRMLTFRWKNLLEIPSVAMYARTDLQGKEIPRTSELKRSPFVLLPKSIQDQLIQMAGERVRDMSGFHPNPIREPGPQSRDILKNLVVHYTAKEAKALTEKQIIDLILEKHVEIIPRELSGQDLAVTLDPQTGDILYSSLFNENDPINRALLGQGHPASYHFGGSVLRSDGGTIVFDELYRNRPELLEKLLRFIEAGELNLGGAPSFKVYTFKIAATNDESIEAAKKRGTMNALRSRSLHVPQRRSISPHEIGKTALLMKGMSRLQQRRLSAQSKEQEEASEKTWEWMPAKLNDLYPLPTQDGYVGFNRRFALQYVSERTGRDVFIAPHSIEFMSNIVAATRLVTEVKQPELQKEGMKVMNSGVFRSPVERLRFLNGDLQITPNERLELRRLHDLLHEGEKGIDQRDAAFVWLSEAIDLAATPEHAYTLTPEIVLMSLRRLLDKGSLGFSDHEERLHWMNLADDIQSQFLIPWISRDVLYAMSAGNEQIDQTYEVVRAEILELASDEEATKIQLQNGQTQAINHSRLKEIKEHYKKKNGGRPLLDNEVMLFHADERHRGSQHRALREAIVDLYASRMTDLASFSDVASYAVTGNGKADVRTRFAEISGVLIGELGYNERSIAVALQLYAEHKARTEQLGTRK